MKISRTAAFRALSRRRAAARASTPTWGVYRVNRSGDASTKLLTAYFDEASAVEGAAYLASLNPGTAFVARELAE